MASRIECFDHSPPTTCFTGEYGVNIEHHIAARMYNVEQHLKRDIGAENQGVL